jgi:hypothetical protein
MRRVVVAVVVVVMTVIVVVIVVVSDNALGLSALENKETREKYGARDSMQSSYTTASQCLEAY